MKANGLRAVVSEPVCYAREIAFEMRIYDPSTRRVLDKVTLLLTPEEMMHLAGYAEPLAEEPTVVNTHAHVNDEAFRREITLVVVTEETVPTLVEHLQKILRD
jgi:hypothetical protein